MSRRILFSVLTILLWHRQRYLSRGVAIMPASQVTKVDGLNVPKSSRGPWNEATDGSYWRRNKRLAVTGPTSWPLRLCKKRMKKRKEVGGNGRIGGNGSSCASSCWSPSSSHFQQLLTVAPIQAGRLIVSLMPIPSSGGDCNMNQRFLFQHDPMASSPSPP